MSALSNELPHLPPEVGDLVHVRSRRWLVEAVDPEGGASLVSLACAEDDAQGEELRVLWELELDRAIVRDEGWSDIGRRGFDQPRTFAAFLNTLRWNAVTATDPTLFQAPFRAGIKLDAYQMEPLRKALQLPRVNLFIADDTGLGKTIEAGLIASELLLRKKAKSIVVAAPPSVLEQWKAELEERFGLTFVVLDRDYLARMRRDRGFGINPWRTHSRELYPEVVDGHEDEGGVPSRLIKTERRRVRQEGTPWRMFAGSRMGSAMRSRSRWTTSLVKVLVG